MVGQVVLFAGYTELAEGQDELLIKDEKVRIESINDDGSLVVYTLDRKDDQGNLIGDQAFPEEVTPTGDPADIPAAEPAKRTRGKKADAKEAPAADAAPAADKNVTKAAKAPKEAKAIKPKANVVTMTDAESVKEILAESGDAVAAAKALVEQGEKTDFTLGGVLHHIYSEGVFKAVVDPSTGKAYEGKRGFADFVERELGVQYRYSII